MKIRSLGAEMFHADRQTDMTTLMVAFHSFVNTFKKGKGETFIMRNFLTPYLHPMTLG